MENFKEKYQVINERLFHDFLDLCESYQSDLTVPEFVFALQRCLAKLAFDTAPNEMVAREALGMGIEEALVWSKEEFKDENNS